MRWKGVPFFWPIQKPGAITDRMGSYHCRMILRRKKNVWCMHVYLKPPSVHSVSDEKCWIWSPKYSFKAFIRAWRCLGLEIKALLYKNSLDLWIWNKYGGDSEKYSQLPSFYIIHDIKCLIICEKITGAIVCYSQNAEGSSSLANVISPQSVGPQTLDICSLLRYINRLVVSVCFSTKRRHKKKIILCSSSSYNHPENIN